jgi:hypothetical protein
MNPSKLHQIETRLLSRLSVLATAIAFGSMSVVVPPQFRMAFALAASLLLTLFVFAPYADSMRLPFDAQFGAGTSESLAAIAGDLKTVYGSVLVQVLPDAAILQKRFPLSDSAEYPLVGDYFSALIGLQYPWGFSFLGQGTENTATNTTLGDALAGQTQPAKIYANMTVLTDNLAYQVLDRANTSGGKQAILSALTYTGKQMAINMRNVLELELLHGRDGIGVVTATSGAGPFTLTLDPTTTSPGILSILIGARLQFMQTNNTSARTANSTTLFGTVTGLDLSDVDNPKVIVTQTGAANFSAVQNTDIMFIAGTRGVAVTASDTNVPQYEQIGLGQQLSLTSGTTVFSIDKAAYPGWIANQMASVGAFSPSVLMTMIQKALSRGGELGDYLAVMSPRAWAVLNSALATNEVYNQQAPSFAMQKKTGTDEIVIKHAGVTIECVPHPFQKDGSVFTFPVSQVHRIGSTDLTFQVPGKPSGDEYMYPVNGSALMQRQCRADWQTALLKPPSGTVATGLTYS